MTNDYIRILQKPSVTGPILSTEECAIVLFIYIIPCHICAYNFTDYCPASGIAPGPALTTSPCARNDSHSCAGPSEISLSPCRVAPSLNPMPVCS